MKGEEDPGELWITPSRLLAYRSQKCGRIEDAARAPVLEHLAPSGSSSDLAAAPARPAKKAIYRHLLSEAS